MKVQQVSYYVAFLSISHSFASASLLDFKYDFCDSDSLLSSVNPLCDRPSTSTLDLPILRGSASKPQAVLDSALNHHQQHHDHSHVHQDHDHDHNHDHDHTHPDSAWSLPPSCTAHPNTTDSFCVFTSHTFASNRGISIFANSIYSSSLHALPAFSTPSTLSSLNSASDPRYASQPIPDKGLGLVALRPIHRGEVLFRSTPVFIFQEDESSAWLHESQRISTYHVAHSRLPARSRGMFDELKGHFGGDPVEDKINTNCFAVELDVEGLAVTATAVFPEMSRMNHDCRPNAHYYFDPLTLVQHVHALRTILPGEEITISYIDPAQPSQTRKDALHTSWGFPCSCNACNAADPIREASDQRIEEIQRLQAMLADYTASSEVRDSRQGVQIAEVLVELYKIEGMIGPLAEAYAFAAIEYSSAMKKWEAIRYAHLALEAGLLYGGPRDDDVVAVRELLDGPEKHWSWGVRGRRRWEAQQGQEQSVDED